MDRPVFKVVIFSECVVLISGIGMAPPSGMGGSETSEYSIFVNRSLLLFVFVCVCQQNVLSRVTVLSH